MKRTIIYILCLAAFVEVSSRIFWRMLDRTWGFVVPQQIGRYDPDLGWSLAPGVSASSKTTGVNIDYAINAQGTRGPEIARQKPDGVFRIAVVGDSHTFGFGLRQQFTIPNLLQGYFKNVEVQNMAVSGFGIDQMLLRMRRDGYAYTPDVVICYVPHFADYRHMTDKIWNLGKPRFVEKDGALTLENCPVANNSALFMALMTADRHLSEWCRTYEILRNTVYWVTVAATTPAPKAQPAPPRGDSTPDNRTAETIALGFAIAQQFDREAKANGAKFVLATRVGELALEAFTKGQPECVFFGVPLINEAMILAHDPFKHPNEAASGVIAWELSKFLKEKGLVPKEYWRVPQVQ